MPSLLFTMGIETIFIVVGVIIVVAVLGLGRRRRGSDKDSSHPSSFSE